MEVAVPPFFPRNLLPSSIISTSVTSKLKTSAAYVLELFKIFKIKIKKIYNNLFIINFIYH